MKKYLSIGLVLLIFAWLTFACLFHANNRSFIPDCIDIGKIDKLVYTDLNGDGVKEVLFEAEGSVNRLDENIIFLRGGHLTEPGLEKLRDYYNRIQGIFYKRRGKWIPLLLNAYERGTGNKILLFTAVGLLKNNKKQVILNFSHGGEAGGIDYYLFQFNDKLDVLFHTWHDKYGGDVKYNIYHGTIIDKRALYTPFQTPTHYYTSLWDYKILNWREGRFKIVKEWMEWNRGYQGFTLEFELGCGNEPAKRIYKRQERFKAGKEQWRGRAIGFVKRKHPEFLNYRVIFNKNGLAIVELAGNKNNRDYKAKSYLYQPFYKISEKSIWEEASFGKAGVMGVIPLDDL